MEANNRNIDFDALHPATHFIEENVNNDPVDVDHQRPLPPPQSRAAVINQSKHFGGYTIISQDSDILVAKCIQEKHARDSDVFAPAQAVFIETRQRSSRASSGFYRHATNQAVSPCEDLLSSPKSAPHKRRRLCPTFQASEIATSLQKPAIKDKSEVTVRPPENSNTEPETGEVIPQQDRVCTSASLCPQNAIEPSGATESDESYDKVEDEGYSSFAVSPEKSSLTKEEQEECLVKHLARLHYEQSAKVSFEICSQRRSLSVQPASNYPNPSVVSYQEAQSHMLEEQTKGAERSRLLRERALARRNDAGQRNAWMDLSSSLFEEDALDMRNDDSYDLSAELAGSDDLIGTGSEWEREKDCSKKRVQYGHQSKENESDMPSGDTQDEWDKEKLLDIAQKHATRFQQTPNGTFWRRNKSNRPRNAPKILHPASRAAAETFRTQSRHLASANNQNKPLIDVRLSNEDAENRLLQFTRRTEHGKVDAETTFVNAYDNQELEQPWRPRFYDASSTPRPCSVWEQRHTRGNDHVLECARVSNEETSGTHKDSAPSAFSNKPLVQNFKNRSKQFSGLEGGIQRPWPSQSASKYSERMNCDILKPDDLAIGKSFVQLTMQEQEVIIEHERLKEFQKDLVAIETTSREIAALRALRPLRLQEQNELQELWRFVALVLNQQKSGKFRRPRILSIRSNMVRRREGRIVSAGTIEEKLILILGASRIRLLNDRKMVANERGECLQAERLANTAKRRNEKSKLRLKQRTQLRKQVRFEDIPDQREKQGPKQPKHPRKLALDEKIARKEAELRLYQDADHTKPTYGSTNDGQPVLDDPHEDGSDIHEEDSDSETSEEEDGAAYAFSAGRGLMTSQSFTAPTSFPERTYDLEIDQDLDEIERLENQRQEEEPLAAEADLGEVPAKESLQRGQRPDLRLIRQMQRTRFDRATTPSSTSANEKSSEDSDRVIFYDIQVQNDSEELSDTASSSNLDTSCQIFRYRVLAQFSGIEIYKPGDEYEFGDYCSLDKAKERVGVIVTSIQRNHLPKYGLENGKWDLRVRNDNGLVEQILEIGEDSAVQARVWIKRRLVHADLGKLACRRAKKMKLVENKPVFIVNWEKTTMTPPTWTAAAKEAQAVEEIPVTRVREATNRLGEFVDVNAEKSVNSDEEDEDDLFGPSRSASPGLALAPTSTITKRAVTTDAASPEAQGQTPLHVHTERATGDQLSFYTDATLANRAAKDIYMAWYSSHLPGISNIGWIRQTEDALEVELQRMGSWGLFEWDEELLRNTSGVKGVEGRGEKVKERMRVWVEKVSVKGPAN